MNSELEKKLSEIEKNIKGSAKYNINQMFDKIKKSHQQIYNQLESLSWLQRRLSIKNQLPPLRSWAASPDVLLKLHTHIMDMKPNIIVELGSGASTLVIADALRQNGFGQLISLEHSSFYGEKTMATLKAEHLQHWVDLRMGELEPWQGSHLNPDDAEKSSQWYPISLLQGVENVELLWIDGPPGSTCLYSRYPAVLALFDRLASNAQIWLDDAGREEEKAVCEAWSQRYGLAYEHVNMEKGLGILSH